MAGDERYSILEDAPDRSSKWKLFCLNTSDSIPKNSCEAIKKSNKD